MRNVMDSDKESITEDVFPGDRNAVSEKTDFRSEFGLMILLVVILVLIVAMSIFFAFSGTHWMMHRGPHRHGFMEDPVFFGWFLRFTVLAVLIAFVVILIMSRFMLKPIHRLTAAADRISRGDYTVRVRESGPSEIRRLNRSFNHMAEELGGVEMLRSDFINEFAHEFKTPIVSIRGFAKLLKREDLEPGKRREYLDIIIKESERLAGLSGSVLQMAKVEKQVILSEVAWFNVSEQIRLVIAQMMEKWQQKDVTVSMETGPRNGPGEQELLLTGNEEMLRQVWINILDNAYKFTPAHGEIRVYIHIEGNIFTADVWDSGPQITPETAARMFDKFYQGDSSRATEGNGLGLAIAKKIVHLHGGGIGALPVRDGATIRIQLPVRK